MRVGEGVDGATEVAHAKEKQIGVLFDDSHRVQDLVGKVPGGRAGSVQDQAIGRNGRDAHARELLADRLRRLRV